MIPERLIFAGSLSLLIVPVVMFAASARLVAVVAVPVTLPIKSLVIVAGSLSLLMVPVVMFAASARFVFN